MEGSITVTSQISSGVDDVEEHETDGSVYIDSSDLELVHDTYDSQGNQMVGLRFQNVSVPQGATITDAYILFTADEVSSGAVSLTIQGEAVDNADPFSLTDYDVSHRSRTTESVVWSPSAWSIIGAAEAEQQTPNLSAVVQEIVDGSGWQTGNAMAMIITGTGTRIAESYDGRPESAPELVITYTAPESKTQEMTLRAGYNLISFNVIPSDSAFATIMDNSIDDVEYVRDLAGNTLTNVDSSWVGHLGKVDASQGYLVKLNRNSTITVDGSTLSGEIVVSLQTGNNLFPYLEKTSRSITDVLEPIITNVQSVKDEDGNMARNIDGRWVNNIGDMKPGKAYVIKMNAADDFTYDLN